MTAGRLGKEQRAEARSLFFVFINLDVINRRGVLAHSYAIRQMAELFATKEFRYNTFV
jgi:hypothetical protein